MYALYHVFWLGYDLMHLRSPWALFFIGMGIWAIWRAMRWRRQRW